MVKLYLGLILLLVMWIFYLWNRRRHYWLMLKVPGPMGYPFLGAALDLKIGEKGNNLLSIWEGYFKKYGTTVLAWFGPVPFILSSEPQVAQDILTSPHCVDKSPYMYKLLDELFGIGLVTSDSVIWTQHRKILNPAFKQNVLISFLPLFNNEANSLLKLMDSYVGQGGKDILPALKNLTLKIATQTTMGFNVKEEDCFKDNTLLNSYEILVDLGEMLVFSPLFNNRLFRRFWQKEKQFTQAKARVREFIKKIVHKNLETNESSTESNTFINEAIKQLKNGNFSYQDVLDECYTIVFTAFETTYNTIGYTIMLLAMFPQFQEKVFEELQEIFPNAGDFDVTYEDIQKMDYLQRVLSEAMRLLPPVPLIARYTTQDVQLSNGISVPSGTSLAVSVFHLQRSKEVWGPQAETFNPEHFLSQNVQDRHSYAYIPFAKGLRNCIGWRYALILAKVTLAKLLRNYKFCTDFHYENLILNESVTLKLQQFPLMELERRV